MTIRTSGAPAPDLRPLGPTLFDLGLVDGAIEFVAQNFPRTSPGVGDSEESNLLFLGPETRAPETPALVAAIESHLLDFRTASGAEIEYLRTETRIGGPDPHSSEIAARIAIPRLVRELLNGRPGAPADQDEPHHIYCGFQRSGGKRAYWARTNRVAEVWPEILLPAGGRPHGARTLDLEQLMYLWIDAVIALYGRTLNLWTITLVSPPSAHQRIEAASQYDAIAERLWRLQREA